MTFVSDSRGMINGRKAVQINAESLQCIVCYKSLSTFIAILGFEHPDPVHQTIHKSLKVFAFDRLRGLYLCDLQVLRPRSKLQHPMSQT